MRIERLQKAKTPDVNCNKKSSVGNKSQPSPDEAEELRRAIDESWERADLEEPKFGATAYINKHMKGHELSESSAVRCWLLSRNIVSESTLTRLQTSTHLMLDTSVAIPMLRRHLLSDSLLATNRQLLPSIALGELILGAIKSRQVQESMDSLNTFVDMILIADCDAEVAKKYGQIRKHWETIDRRIPENDIWIAATAMRHELPLMTADAHCNAVDGLKVINWPITTPSSTPR